MSRRPCQENHCKYCDRYEQRYSAETKADLKKYEGETGAVKVISSNEEKYRSGNRVTLPSNRSDSEVTLPCLRSVSEDTLPSDGTVQEHIHSVSYDCQDKDPEHVGPIITDDNFSGRRALTTTCLGPRVAEVLSSEMTHGMSQDGVPHFMHATLKSACTGVDANTHEI